MRRHADKPVLLELHKDRIRKVLKKKERFLRNRKLAVFTITELSQTAVQTLREMGLEVSMAFDNAPAWDGRRWMGIPVAVPDERRLRGMTVIAATGYEYDKTAQLKALGVPEDQILIIGPEEINLPAALGKVTESVFLYRRLRKQYGPHLLLCPYPGTGDAFLTGRYLHNLVEYHGWREYTILVTGRAFQEVMRLYGYENCVLITKYECECLKFLLTSFGGEKTGIHDLLYWGLSIQTAALVENKTSFLEIFSNTVFGPYQKKPALLDYRAGADGARAVMEEHGLEPGKTVLLAPAANSFREELPGEWWARLARAIRERGYTTATNCGPGELPVRDTKRVELPYNALFPVLERCGYIIGVRSGLFDLISGVNCKKIILYQDFINPERMEFFSLRNMGLCDDAVELKLDATPGGRDRLMEQVMERLPPICRPEGGTPSAAEAAPLYSDWTKGEGA